MTSAPLVLTPTDNPLVQQLIDVHARLDEFSTQKTSYVAGTVTALDNVGFTFAANITQPDGSTSNVAGIRTSAQFMPSIGTVVTLALDGPQIIFMPFGVANSSIDTPQLSTTVSSNISTAQSTATSAQTIANTKIVTFYATTSPTASEAGDFWVNTASNNTLYRWSGSAWVQVQDQQIQSALVNANTAQNTANTKIITFYQGTSPTATETGDFWVNTASNNTLYRWNGSSWVQVQDQQIQTALTNAASAQTTATSAQTTATTAQTTANGKNKVTYSTGAATGSGTATGDIWFQIDGSGVVTASWAWTGSAWVSHTFGDAVLNSLTAGKITTGTLAATVTLSGSIKTAATGSRVEIDSGGVTLYDSSNNAVVDLQTAGGAAYFRGTVESALIRTASSGARLEITSGSKTLTFYPSSGAAYATISSVDDGSGVAGISANAGGSNRGFLDFTSTYADLGYWSGTSATAFVKCNPPAATYGIELSTGTKIAITVPEIRFFDAAYTFASLKDGDGLSRVCKFSTQNNTTLGGTGTDTSFTFGTNPGNIDADVYAGRFIATVASPGGFVYFSDSRLKQNIRDASFDALTEIRNTRIRQFEWIATGQTDIGFVAQEVPADAQSPLVPNDPVDGIADPIGVSADKMVVKLWKAAQESAAIFLALKAWHDNVQNNQVRSVETRVVLPALAVGTPVDVAVPWPGAPLAAAPDTAICCQEVPAGLLGRLTTQVLPASIDPNGCTVRVTLTSGTAIAAGGGQLHVTALAWK